MIYKNTYTVTNSNSADVSHVYKRREILEALRPRDVDLHVAGKIYRVISKTLDISGPKLDILVKLGTQPKSPQRHNAEHLMM